MASIKILKEWRGDYLIEQLSKDNSIKTNHSFRWSLTFCYKTWQKYNHGILAQTGTALENVGKISFLFNHHKVSDLKASLINVKDTNKIKADPSIEKQVNKANNEFKNI